MAIHIITRSINAYEQDGEYFVAVFDAMPSFNELKEALPEDAKDATIGKLLRGGGREGTEYEWFHLRAYRPKAD